MASTTPVLWKSLSKVNTTDSANAADGQFRSRVIGLADGGFVVVWEDDTNTYSQMLGPNDIVGQRYDVLGNKAGIEFHVSANYLDFNQQAAAVTGKAGGGFYVA